MLRGVGRLSLPKPFKKICANSWMRRVDAGNTLVRCCIALVASVWNFFIDSITCTTGKFQNLCPCRFAREVIHLRFDMNDIPVNRTSPHHYTMLRRRPKPSILDFDNGKSVSDIFRMKPCTHFLAFRNIYTSRPNVLLSKADSSYCNARSTIAPRYAPFITILRTISMSSSIIVYSASGASYHQIDGPLSRSCWTSTFQG